MPLEIKTKEQRRIKSKVDKWALISPNKTERLRKNEDDALDQIEIKRLRTTRGENKGNQIRREVQGER